LLRHYLEPGRLLDVGCAAGFIMQGLQDAGWTVEGIEPNEHMAKYARLQGLDVKTGTLEDFHSQARFDLITMIQVVPHFYNLRRALEAAKTVTKPGGFWLIETWDRESFLARLFGKSWHEYSPPSVLHYFSSGGLIQMVTRYGFTLSARGRPDKRLNGSHAKSLLNHSLFQFSSNWLFRTGLKLIPDQLELPYPALDLFWMLFQRD
jgi:SAM-dependent methyltransferase